MPPQVKRAPLDFRRDIFAILFLAVGVFLTLCLASYSPTDPALNSVSNVPYVKNWGGLVGAYIADILYIVFGFSAYILVAVLFLVSVLQFMGRSIRLRVREVFFYVGMLTCASALIHLQLSTFSIRGHEVAGGGILGGLLGEVLTHYFNRAGAYIFSSVAFLLLFTLATHLSFVEIALLIRDGFLIVMRASLRVVSMFGRGVGSIFKVSISRGAKKSRAEAGAVEEPSLGADDEEEEAKAASTTNDQEDVDAEAHHLPPRIARMTGQEVEEPTVAGEEEASVESSPEGSKLEFLRKPFARSKEVETVTLTPIRRPRSVIPLPARPAGSVPPKPEGLPEAEVTPLVPRTKPAKTELVAEVEAEPSEATSSGAPKILKRAEVKQRSASDQLKLRKMTAEGYEPPPIALLSGGEVQKVEIDEATLTKNSMLLEKKLKDFDVEGRVVAIHPGPVITMYEFEPAAGTKVNKIVGLQDDLSLTLGGRSVRIVPHLPGKAALGIEIPNADRETVWLRQIVSSQPYAKSSGKLSLALGSSTTGHPVVTDLTKMPHLLVAGATGSGKSVAINSFIISILMRSSPEDVRFIMVDPKMLELSVYDGIPHLLLPVVTKPKPAVTAMRWAIREMERRYRLMADAGTRNIIGYNDKLKEGGIKLVTAEEAQQMLATDREAVAHTGKLPYIVILIDELADLMMTASQDMEECITRLAQMARAAGIHLVLATQRPSVDVITGLIKANFPARIAFKVTAKHDSRTILDAIGAETLLGNGDMLFMTPQGGNLIRIHGAYVTDDDISRVVAHLKEQGEPVYDESILAEPESAAGASGEVEEGDDEMYDQAVRLVTETKQASISMVQRRLRIGYNRAARMIERMEAEGVIGPAEGSRPRQVLAQGR